MPTRRAFSPQGSPPSLRARRPRGFELAPRALRGASLRALGVVSCLLVSFGCSSAPPPASPGVIEWVRRGQQLLEPERAEQARHAFSQALLLDPDCLPALLGRAQASVWAGASEPALTDLTQALAARPLAEAHWLRGSLFARRGDLALAAADLRTAALLAPREAPAYSSLAQVELHRGNLDEALEAIEVAAQLAPDEPRVHTLRGAILLKMHRYTESCAALTRALEARASDQTYELRGDAFFAQGEHQAAVVDYTEVLRRQPTSLCRVARGLCFFELDRHGEAERDFSRWLEANPDDARVVFWRGVTRVANGRYDDAQADFTRALSLDPPPLLRERIEARMHQLALARDEVY